MVSASAVAPPLLPASLLQLKPVVATATLPPDPSPALPVGDAASARREAFTRAHGRLCREILDEADAMFDLPAGARQFLEDGLRGGKGRGDMLQGLSFVECHAALVSRELSAEEARRVSVLGWVSEWVSSCFRVAATFMDTEYRGRADLFDRVGFGGRGLNEALMLEPLVYRVVRRYFRLDRARYVRLFELIQDASYAAQAGQVVDRVYRADPSGRVDLSRYTADALRRVYLHRCSLHEFYFPLAMALVLADADVSDARLAAAKAACVAIGAIAQAQTDIYEALAPRAHEAAAVHKARCTWPLVHALGACTPEDRALLAENLGKPGGRPAAAVRGVYVRAGVHDAFSAHWDGQVDAARDLITQADAPLRDSLTAMLAEVVGCFAMPSVAE